MTREDVAKLFKRIKAYYPTFRATDKDTFEEWCLWLKDYSDDGVNKNLIDYYKEGHDDPPKIVNLINEFIRVKKEKRCIMCKYCTKTFTDDYLLHLKNHEDRHRSIKYIKRVENKIGKNFSEEKLLDMESEEFEKFYNLFLEELYKSEKTNTEERFLISMALSRGNNNISIQEVVRSL